MLNLFVNCKQTDEMLCRDYFPFIRGLVMGVRR